MSLSALADAGLEEVCLVIGPEHEAVREYYTKTAPPRRVRLAFAVQEEPRGTADAVLAAEEFAAGEDFLVINSDNYYPVAALAALAGLSEPGVVLFERDALDRYEQHPRRADRFLRRLRGRRGRLSRSDPGKAG